MSNIKSKHQLHNLELLEDTKLKSRSKRPAQTIKNNLVISITNMLSNELNFAKVRSDLMSLNKGSYSKSVKKELNLMFNEKKDYHKNNLEAILPKVYKCMFYDNNGEKTVTPIDKFGLKNYDETIVNLSDNTVYQIKDYLIRKEGYPFMKHECVFPIPVRPVKKKPIDMQLEKHVDYLLDSNKAKIEFNTLLIKKMLSDLEDSDI